MKFYIASRIQNEAAVSELTEKLKTKDHTVTLDWTQLEGLKPYEQNSKRSAEAAAQMIKAVQDADLFVIFPQTGGDYYRARNIAPGSYQRVLIRVSMPPEADNTCQGDVWNLTFIFRATQH